MKARHSYIERRRFLGGMVCGGAAAFGGTVAVPLVAYVANRHGEPVPDVEVYELADWHTAAGEARIVRYGPLPVLIVRVGAEDRAAGRSPALVESADLRVFVATCTHLDCIVGYDPQQRCIVCACHDGRFDLDGRVLAGPPPAPLRRMYHEVREDRLCIAMEKHHLETRF